MVFVPSAGSSMTSSFEFSTEFSSRNVCKILRCSISKCDSWYISDSRSAKHEFRYRVKNYIFFSIGNFYVKSPWQFRWIACNWRKHVSSIETKFVRCRLEFVAFVVAAPHRPHILAPILLHLHNTKQTKKICKLAFEHQINVSKEISLAKNLQLSTLNSFESNSFVLRSFILLKFT